MIQALLLLQYLVRNGSERVVTSAREHVYDLKPLENFQFIDETGKDQGLNGVLDLSSCRLRISCGVSVDVYVTSRLLTPLLPYPPLPSLSPPAPLSPSLPLLKLHPLSLPPLSRHLFLPKPSSSYHLAHSSLLPPPL